MISTTHIISFTLSLSVASFTVLPVSVGTKSCKHIYISAVAVI